MDPNPLPVGSWTHIAVTMSANVGTLYVNGVSVASSTFTLKRSDLSLSAYWLGKSAYVSPDPNLNGVLDEVYVYNRALSGAEIAALFAKR